MNPCNDSAANYRWNSSQSQQPSESLNPQISEHLRSTFSELINDEDSIRISSSLPKRLKTFSDEWRAGMTQLPLPKTFCEQNHRVSAELERPGWQGREWVWVLKGNRVKRKRSKPLPLPKERLTQKRLKRLPPVRKIDRLHDRNPKDNFSFSTRDFPGQTSVSDVASVDDKIPKNPLFLSSGARSSTSASLSGSKILRGFQYMSPTYPHFKSPTGKPEGLYCKTKRGIEGGLRGKSKEVSGYTKIFHE
jgi:hypothetical protein